MRIAVAERQVRPQIDSVTLTLSADEASKLRRIMYYNKTVARKFRDNPNGGVRKSQDILAFATSLGNNLKAKGVERF